MPFYYTIFKGLLAFLKSIKKAKNIFQFFFLKENVTFSLPQSINITLKERVITTLF